MSVRGEEGWQKQRERSQTLIKAQTQHWNSLCQAGFMAFFILKPNRCYEGAAILSDMKFGFREEEEIKLTHSSDGWFQGISVEVFWPQQWWLW